MFERCYTPSPKFKKKKKKMNAEDTFLFDYFEQTVLQLSKTDKILMLGTEVAFCPLATLVNYFHYKNKDHFKHFCITLYKH